MSNSLKGWAGRLALIAIAMVFLLAGGLKALDPERFADSVRAYGILPDSLAPLVTYILVPLEVALGAALLIDYRRRLAVGMAVVILAGFIGLIAYTELTGGEISDCGCFGELVERSAGEAIAEDFIFITVALLGLMAPRPGEERRRLKGGLTAAAALATLVFIPMAPALHLEWIPVVTRLHPGMNVDDLRISIPDVAFSEGRYLVGLLSLEQEESGEAADALNEIAAMEGAPEVAVIHADPPEVVDAFFWTHAPAYPMYEVLPEEMRGLYRRLPRFFLMEGGVVREVWESIPPAEIFTAAAAIAQEETSS